MGISTLKKEIEGFLIQVEAGEIPPADIESVWRRFELRMDRLEETMGERREQKLREEGIGRTVGRLEARTRAVRDEAKELEATELETEAKALYRQAEELERALREISRHILSQRQQELPALEKKIQELEIQVDDLEVDYEALLRRINEREIEAREEDELNGDIRLVMLYKRAGEYYLQRGREECEFLTERGRYLERGQKLLQRLPEDPNVLVRHGCPTDKAQQVTQEILTAKREIRGHLQDMQHIISEGLRDEDIDGAELSLAYAMRKKWQSGEKGEFYKRLWTLNYLLIHSPEADPQVIRKVRSLLHLLNGPVPPELERQRHLASEAKRFLLMAGNGVIRDLLAENYNGLVSEEDYAQLGADLINPNPPEWLHMIRVAVNIPRLFDLSLNDRFGSIYETRHKRTQVRHVTSFPEMQIADDVDDLPDVPAEELGPDWLRRLLDGDLPKTAYREETEHQVEVGQEKTVEAQMFLLDVSGSMTHQEIQGPWVFCSGQRWLLRNAIFISALNTFSVDARIKGLEDFLNMLFYRTFGERVGPLNAIRSNKEALSKLKEMFNMQGIENSTDLQSALETAYGDVRTAKGVERALRDAKVVVVTDGQTQLNIETLLEAQDIGGTRVVTHVFAVEEQNEELKELSRRSGIGRAFYYFIQNAADQKLMVSPPYGTPDEFSPIWDEPQFDTEDEKERFEASISQLCDDVVTTSRRVRTRRSERDRVQARELESLLTNTAWFKQQPYEEGQTHADTDRRKRKSRRLEDIMRFLVQVSDDKMRAGEVMGAFRHLADSRAVLTREFRAVCRSTGNPKLRGAMVEYRDKILPSLEAEAA